MFQDLSHTTLLFLDYLLYAAHLLLIGFNLLGWIWRKTLRWHLLCVLLTALSWFGLGIWYGFGYCFITDWQWDVKRQLGQSNLPDSFIDHFVNQVMGLSISSQLIDVLTGVMFGLVAIISIVLNWREWKRG